MVMVRYEFEASESRTEESLAPRDFDHCDSLEKLEEELCEQVTPYVRITVNGDDLNAMWEAVQNLKRTGERL